MAVPGEILGYHKAWLRFGHLPWKDLFKPTIDLCRHGFRVGWSLADSLKQFEKLIRLSPSLRLVLFWLSYGGVYGVKCEILLI